MTVEPDIVKMLREEEKPRKLGGKSQSVYEALKITEEPSDDIPDEIIESIENTGKAGDDRIYSKKYDKSIEAVLKIIQFTEKVATKIHGVTDEGEIYRLVMEEFKKSKEYSANIFLLTDDESKLSVMTSMKSKRLRAAEKLTGLKQEGFKISLSKAETYSRVVGAGETLHIKVSDVLNELFSRPIAYLIAKITGNINSYDVITPLDVNGKIIGIFGMTFHSMVEEVIPSVKNLARHLSASLELAKENTKRKEIEKSLKKSEGRFWDVVLISADWIWELDKDGKYTFASGKIKEILGYEPEELIGKTPFDLMSDEEAKRVGEIFKKIASEKKPIVDLENWSPTKEGEKICLLTNGVPMLNENGELMGYRGVDKDITKQKKAMDALNESEETFRSIFDGANDAIFLYDVKTGRMLNANKKMCGLYGYTFDEALKSSIDDISSGEKPYTQKEAGGWIKKAVNGPQLFEWHAKDKKGKLFWVEVNLKKVSVLGQDQIMAVVRDISERKKTIEELNQRVDELEIFNDVAVGRELKMIKLKKEINELCEKYGEKFRYEVD